MYTIIIFFIIAIVVGVALIKSSIDEELKVSIVYFIIFIGITLGVFSPLSGFTKSIPIEEVTLMPFTSTETYLSDDEQDIFVQISHNTTFYKYAVPRIVRKDDASAFDIITASIKDNIEVQEISNCDAPVLVVYEKKGKKSKWTFALFCSEKEYVFYIPTGSKQYLN